MYYHSTGCNSTRARPLESKLAGLRALVSSSWVWTQGQRTRVNVPQGSLLGHYATLLRLLYSPSDAVPSVADCLICDAASAECELMAANASGDVPRQVTAESVLAQSMIEWSHGLPILA